MVAQYKGAEALRRHLSVPMREDHLEMVRDKARSQRRPVSAYAREVLLRDIGVEDDEQG